MLTEKLLQCPFCGGTNLSASCHSPFIICEDCGAFGPGSADSTHEEAAEAWNIRAVHGTLTAEQVMEIAGRHQPDYCSDTHVCFDWQAIADELNAMLGGGKVVK